MIKRLLTLLTLAAVSVATTANAADVVGRGSIGGSGGVMKFTSGDDFSDGNPRIVGQVHFKYNFTGSLAGIIESGYGWNNYDTAERIDKDSLVVVVPTTLGLEYRFHWGETKVWPHLALGGGLYSLGVKDSHRTWAHGGIDAERLTWTSPGFYGKLGAEYLFDNGVSINFDFLYHQIFSDNDKYTPPFYPLDFYDPNNPALDEPDEYNQRFLEERAATGNTANSWGVQNTSFAEVRLGVNYYFTLKSAGPAPPEEE